MDQLLLEAVAKRLVGEIDRHGPWRQGVHHRAGELNAAEECMHTIVRASSSLILLQLTWRNNDTNRVPTNWL